MLLLAHGCTGGSLPRPPPCPPIKFAESVHRAQGAQVVLTPPALPSSLLNQGRRVRGGDTGSLPCGSSSCRATAAGEHGCGWYRRCCCCFWASVQGARRGKGSRSTPSAPTGAGTGDGVQSTFHPVVSSHTISPVTFSAPSSAVCISRAGTNNNLRRTVSHKPPPNCLSLPHFSTPTGAGRVPEELGSVREGTR